MKITHSSIPSDRDWFVVIEVFVLMYWFVDGESSELFWLFVDIISEMNTTLTLKKHLFENAIVMNENLKGKKKKVRLINQLNRYTQKSRYNMSQKHGQWMDHYFLLSI